MGDEILFNTEGFSRDNLPKQNNYETALNEAAEKLRRADIDEIIVRSGARPVPDKNTAGIIVPFINRNIRISLPEPDISYNDEDRDVEMWLKILVLHYLIYAKGTQPTGTETTFKQLEGGLSYFSAFQKRTIIPLLKTFGDNMDDFIRTGTSLGGEAVNQGASAVSFRVFPEVMITCILWKGDDEFPAEGSVIFDENIAEYLTTEDIVVMCNMIAVMMIKKYNSRRP